MPKARVDRTTVSLRSALNWILSDDFDRQSEPLPLHQVSSADELKAKESLLVALRDAELCATGRYSNASADPREEPHYGRKWIMHSRWSTKIMCKNWRRGKYDWSNDALDLPDGQYIDIQVPRFMVEASWPLDPMLASKRDDTKRPYSTPYLDMMHQAIIELGISPDNQPKKDVVVEWFRQHRTEQLPISDNLIGHMSTFVRLPDTQKGGNRKWKQAVAPSEG